VLNAFWLIPILPLAGFVANGLLIKWMPRKLAGLLACATVGVAFLISAGAFFELRALPLEERSITHVLFPWIAAGNFHVNVAFMWDPLAAVMAMVVSGVGFLIHVYSIGYMAHDPGYKRYFTFLNLFTFAMLTLVMADNFLLLFVGWEGVGLCSYLLIGFWYVKDSASNAGKKAFIVNRIGDFGVLIGMFLLFWTLGTLNFSEVFAKAPTVYTAGTSWGPPGSRPRSRSSSGSPTPWRGPPRSRRSSTPPPWSPPASTSSCAPPASSPWPPELWRWWR
jgi:NADH-quinone oxidoreductase subunit L